MPKRRRQPSITSRPQQTTHYTMKEKITKTDLELAVQKKTATPAKNGAMYRRVPPHQDKRKGPNSNGACRGGAGVANTTAINRLKSKGWAHGLKTIRTMFPRSKPGNCGICAWEDKVNRKGQ